MHIRDDNIMVNLKNEKEEDDLYKYFTGWELEATAKELEYIEKKFGWV